MAVVTGTTMGTVSCECGNLIGRTWWPITQTQWESGRFNEKACPICKHFWVNGRIYFQVEKAARPESCGG